MHRLTQPAPDGSRTLPHEPLAAQTITDAQRPLHILYLIDYWGAPGGTERHLFYLLKHLDPARFRRTLVMFKHVPNALVDEIKALGIEVALIPVERYYTPNALLQARRLHEFIRSRQIDAVQTFHYKADIYGAIVARAAGVRHIIASKRDAADYKNSFHFFLHRLVRPITERYIAVSKVVSDVLHDKEGVMADRVNVIYNGVNLQQHTPPDAPMRAAARTALGFSDSDFVIGMSAWFRPEKDHQLLIDAFLKILPVAAEAKLLLIGGGPLLGHYRDWVARQGLEDKIRIVGPVDDVRPFLRACDVACLVPHINEGFSNSVLEKMATGLPVIVTDVGGNKEAVTEGQNGFVIAPRDGSRLTQHLTTLYRDAALRRTFGEASRRLVEQHFSLERMIERHEQLYLSMTSAQ